MNSLDLKLSMEPDTRIGLVQVENAVDRKFLDPTIYQSPDALPGYHVFTVRVMEPLRGMTRGERAVFFQLIRPARKSEWSMFGSPPVPPKMVAGEEYLVIANPGHEHAADEIRMMGFPDPIWRADAAEVIHSEKNRIREILPQLNAYLDAWYQPPDLWPAAMRRWIFANLNPKNAFLRHILHKDLAQTHAFYWGMTKEEVDRIAAYTDIVGGYERFQILENLALDTDHPMDYWYLRAMSKGAPGRIDPEDLPLVNVFGDTLLGAAKKLSIDTFWPLIARPAKGMSIWVEAFAKQGDPRLLPIILRYLEPGRVDYRAVGALAYYKGQPAVARAVIDLLRKHDYLSKENLRPNVVYDALAVLGTAESYEEALRLKMRQGNIDHLPDPEPPRPPASRRPEPPASMPLRDHRVMTRPPEIKPGPGVIVFAQPRLKYPCPFGGNAGHIDPSPASPSPKPYSR
jgi:hypothetical protein